MKKNIFLLVLSGALLSPILRATGEDALPVRETWVPENVFKTIKDMYMSQGLYDITTIKLPSGNEGYVIRLIKGSQESTMAVDAAGKPVQ
ncbi:hypothetical protein [Chitinophaga sp. 212800010-3]|uniref:hypothetical protein n=1 Tax=unclassified Chitinophaga TaxID=2619133 RepID=UPI002DEC67E4|nr:PepSY-like beta-lactamase-inhibitor [Chitinophaga sp. 212800010-3]